MAVADIFIRIVTKGAELANKQMSNLGGTTKKLAGIVKGAGLAFATGLAIGITKATREFIEFEDALNQSLAIMNTTIAQQENMARAAREVAVTTRVSATESAESFFFLASAGLDAEQSIAALPQVAKFAQAGMFDMSLATDLATDAQSALGLTVQDAQQNLENLTRVTDVLVKANTLANASVQQFSEALTTKAGAALKVVNKDIEEGVAVLAAFADRGVKGAEAGDKLNQVLRDIPRATAKNSEEFAKLGLNMFDTEGNMKNVADIIEELDRVLGPMSDELKASTLDQLGLNRGVADAVKILSGAGGQIREYEKALRDAGGTTQEVSDKQIQSLSGQAEILRDKFSVAGQLLVEDFAPALEDIILKTGNLLDIFISFQQEEEFTDTVEESTFKLLRLNAVLGAGVGQVGTYTGAVDDLGNAIRTQRLNEQLSNMATNQGAIQDSIDRAMPSFIDARRNTERYAMEQDMLAQQLHDTTDAVEDQTDSVTELSQEMIDNQFNALMGMVDAEKAYNDIIEENEKLLTRRTERETDKAEAQKKLTEATEKVSLLEDELIKARQEATKVTDEEKLAILRQEAAVQRLIDVEDKSELQKQELLVAEKKLNELRIKATGDDEKVIKVLRDLEMARSEEQRAIEQLADAQDRLNDATKEYNDATADTPANILRIAEAKENLDKAIAKVDALDNFRGALLQIVEDTGIGLSDIYQQLMDIKNFDTSSSGSSSTSKSGGSKKTNKSTSGFDDEFIGKSKQAFEDILDERTATDKILSDSKFVGGASGVTTIVNLKNEFNIEGALNSDEVAIKVIEAQKRGLNVVL